MDDMEERVVLLETRFSAIEDSIEGLKNSQLTKEDVVEAFNNERNAEIAGASKRIAWGLVSILFTSIATLIALWWNDSH